jgi:hypothetical protein
LKGRIEYFLCPLQWKNSTNICYSVNSAINVEAAVAADEEASQLQPEQGPLKQFIPLHKKYVESVL